MTRRPGLSLTEVLVALFIMAIGVIGVLTMFPVGAVQMGLALKDQRCAEAAIQADGYMRWYWRHHIVEPGIAGFGSNNEPLWKALNGGALTPPANSNPSPPVFVDPMGCVARSNDISGTITGTPIARRNLLQLMMTPTGVQQTIGAERGVALRTCSLLDGFTYAATGTGIPATTGGTVDRENRYNWLWVIQRPSNAQPYTANMTVVVFDKRAHMYVAPTAELNGTATFATGQTSVNLASYQGLQRGGWVIDTSKAGGVQLADFYRVVSINSTTGQAELQVPAVTPLGGGARPASGSAVVPAGVAEVFSRPQLTADAPVTP